MASMMEKMKSAGTSKRGSILSKSELFDSKNNSPTEVPIINIALSGEVDKGLGTGITFIAGPSRHFKSLLGLTLCKAYLDAHDDAICVFYDCEFGITTEYMQSIGIDPDRVYHVVIENLEELKFDMVNRLESIERGDNVIIFIDSVGNLASKKEIENAMDEKTTADMTRAREMKSLWRILTPKIKIRDIPCVAINHTYETLEMYSKTIMSGGTGGTLAAMSVLFIGRSQEKDGTDLVGYNFTITTDKSRLVKEKSKLTFTVKFDGGIQKYSGLMDIALESGNVIKPKNGWYQKVNIESGEISEKSYRLKDTDNEEFWGDILIDKTFNDFVRSKYKLGNYLVNKKDDKKDME